MSYQCVRFQSSTQPSLRGAPLLSHLFKYVNSGHDKHNKLSMTCRIRHVHACAGHYALIIGEGRMICVLDYTPLVSKRVEELMEQFSKLNEQISLELFSEMTNLCAEKKQQQFEQQTNVAPAATIPSAAPTVQQQQQATNSNAKKTNLLSKFISVVKEKTTQVVVATQQQEATTSSKFHPIPQQQQQASVSPPKPVTTTTIIDTSALQVIKQKPILCLLDASAPFIHSSMEEWYDDHTRLMIVQKNATLHIWRFDDAAVEWTRQAHRLQFLTSTSTSSVLRVAHVAEQKLIYYLVAHENAEHATLWARYYKMENNELVWTSNNAIKCAEAPNQSMLVDVQSLSMTLMYKQLDGPIISDMLPAKDGAIWVFTANRIYYIKPNHNIKMLLARDVHVPMNQLVKSQHVKLIDTIGQQKRLDIHKEFYYASKYVHPLTRELVLLCIDGSIRTTQSTATLSGLYIRTSKSEIMTSGIEEHINRWNQFVTTCGIKEAQKCLDLNRVELFYVYGFVLGITNQDVCTLYESRTGYMLHQLQLPNDLVLYEDYLNHADEKKTICWQMHGASEFRIGFCYGAGIYELQIPPVAEIIRQVYDMRQDKKNYKKNDLFLLANLAGEWRLDALKTKLYLDMLLEEHPWKEKQQVMVELAYQLQNPSLVWTAASSLVEQASLMQPAIQFVQNFPPPDHAVWKNKHQYSISHEQQQVQVHWNALYPKNDNMVKSPQDQLAQYTPLNVSIVQAFTESVALAKEQIDHLSSSKLDSITNVETTSLQFDQMTDVEIELYTREHPKESLQPMCKLVGLECLLNCEAKNQQDLLTMLPSFAVQHFGKMSATLADIELDEYLPMQTPSMDQKQEQQNATDMLDKESIDHILFDDDKYSHYAASNTMIKEQEPVKTINLHGCFYLDTMITLLFASDKPYLLLALVSMLEQYHLDKIAKEKKELQEKTSKQLLDTIKIKQRELSAKSNLNYKKIFSKYVLDTLQAPFVTSELTCLNMYGNFACADSCSLHQWHVLSCLQVWSGQIALAIKYYLYKDLIADAATLLTKHFVNNEQLSNMEEQYELANVLTRYCKSEHGQDTISKQPLWQILVKLIPQSYSVFDLLSQFHSTTNKHKNTSVWAQENDPLTIEQLLPVLKQLQQQQQQLVE